MLTSKYWLTAWGSSVLKRVVKLPSIALAGTSALEEGALELATHPVVLSPVPATVALQLGAVGSAGPVVVVVEVDVVDVDVDVVVELVVVDAVGGTVTAGGATWWCCLKTTHARPSQYQPPQLRRLW